MEALLEDFTYILSEEDVGFFRCGIHSACMACFNLPYYFSLCVFCLFSRFPFQLLVLQERGDHIIHYLFVRISDVKAERPTAARVASMVWRVQLMSLRNSRPS